jgi:hypothetical protein
VAYGFANMSFWAMKSDRRFLFNGQARVYMYMNGGKTKPPIFSGKIGLEKRF